ncbi:hypothetical protein HanRHA438_Chr04g0199981 [Helianthus annuus]|nr:hypothetical protein HanRHA438_Chr04g0199981 [Helianthus annuus]
MNLFMPLEQSNKNNLDNQINKLAAERGGKLITLTTKPKFLKKSASASRSVITKKSVGNSNIFKMNHHRHNFF